MPNQVPVGANQTFFRKRNRFGVGELYQPPIVFDYSIHMESRKALCADQEIFLYFFAHCFRQQ